MEYLYIYIGFPGSSVGKESACSAGDSGSLGSEKSPGEGNDNHSILLSGRSHGQKSLADYTVHGLQKLDTT